VYNKLKELENDDDSINTKYSKSPTIDLWSFVNIIESEIKATMLLQLPMQFNSNVH